MVLHVVNSISGHVCPIYFKINIEEPESGCSTDLQVQRPPQIYWDYERSTEALVIPIPYSVFVPTSCGYDREFILIDPFTNRSPRYATIEGGNMHIETDDFNHCGDRTLRLSIGIRDHHAAPATFQYYISITCCGFATVTPRNVIFPDFDYNIGDDGELTFDPFWYVGNGDPAGCDLAYSFTPS